MWLFAAIIAVPLIEIALFVTLGGWLGLGATMALILGTALLGMTVLRRQGTQLQAALRVPMRADPLAPLADGALVSLAGVLLILPGFFTDTLGALLLIPPLRRLVISRLADRVQVRTAGMRPPGSRDLPIDGDYIDLDAEQRDRLHPPGSSGWTRH